MRVFDQPWQHAINIQSCITPASLIIVRTFGREFIFRLQLAAMSNVFSVITIWVQHVIHQNLDIPHT